MVKKMNLTLTKACSQDRTAKARIVDLIHKIGGFTNPLKTGRYHLTGKVTIACTEEQAAKIEKFKGVAKIEENTGKSVS